MRRMKMLSVRASFQETGKPLWKVEGVLVSGPVVVVGAG